MLLIVAWLASLRVRNYERGGPDDRRTNRKNVEKRFEDFRSGVWMQTLLRDPAAGVMHACIYFGFVGLFIVTVVIELDHQLPDSLEVPARSDLRGVLRVRRRRSRASCSSSASAGRSSAATCSGPYRIRIKTKPEDAVILGTFLAHRPHRLLHRGRAHRARRAGPHSRSGRSSATRSSSLIKTRGRSHTLEQHAPLAVGHPRGGVPRVPRDPADHQVAPHVHVADEHVPAATASGPRAR